EKLEPINKSVFEACIETLGAIGPTASEAVPALEKVMKESKAVARTNAARSIWKINQDLKTTLPVFIEGAQADFESCEVAVDALAQVGPPAKEAVAALSKVVLDSQKTMETRSTAAEALGKIGPDAKGGVEALTKGLAAKSNSLRSACVVSLGEIGPAAKSALPALQQLTKEADKRTS